MMKKMIFSTAVTALLITNFAQARSNLYTMNLVITNCTTEEIQLDTDSKSYKFSLDPNMPAHNGYSSEYSLRIAPQSVLKYPNMTVYFNNHFDGRINLVFSGGVNGEAELKQKEDSYTVWDWLNDGISVYYIDKITSKVKTDSPDIEFANPTQIIQTYQLWGFVSSYAEQNNLVIHLGCAHSHY